MLFVLFYSSSWAISICDYEAISCKITCLVIYKPETDRRFGKIQTLILVSDDDILLVEPDHWKRLSCPHTYNMISNPSVL